MHYLLRDPSLIEANEPLREVRRSRVVLFVMVQLIGFGVTFAIVQIVGVYLTRCTTPLFSSPRDRCSCHWIPYHHPSPYTIAKRGCTAHAVYAKGTYGHGSSDCVSLYYGISRRITVGCYLITKRKTFIEDTYRCRITLCYGPHIIFAKMSIGAHSGVCRLGSVTLAPAPLWIVAKSDSNHRPRPLYRDEIHSRPFDNC